MENRSSESAMEEKWNDNDNKLLIAIIVVIVLKLYTIYRLHKKMINDRTATNVILMRTLIVMTSEIFL